MKKRKYAITFTLEDGTVVNAVQEAEFAHLAIAIQARELPLIAPPLTDVTWTQLPNEDQS